MDIVVKKFEELTNMELYSILRARQDIFIIEQDCIYPDIDGVDFQAIHVLLKEGEELLAYTRLYWEEERECCVKVGRVIAPCRSAGWGLRVMEESVRITKEIFSPKEIFIHAQAYAIGFYEKVGFSVISEEFLEDDIPHVEMVIRC